MTLIPQDLGPSTGGPKYLLVCIKCKTVESLEKDFAKNYRVCKECHNKSQREYVANHKEWRRRIARETAQRLVAKVIDGYGAKCACCGESQREFLTLDHTHGNGSEQRRNSYSYIAHRDAVKRNFPTDYRLLCFNCNCCLGFRGYCPHGGVPPVENHRHGRHKSKD